jgi:hypothetical protein
MKKSKTAEVKCWIPPASSEINNRQTKAVTFRFEEVKPSTFHFKDTSSHFNHCVLVLTMLMYLDKLAGRTICRFSLSPNFITYLFEA